jgi:hypothetical protein
MKMDEREKNILRKVFDALPSLVFVVDRDLKIQEYNSAAAEVMLAKRTNVIRQRTGEVLHCLHSMEEPGGCGKAPDCKSCVIRNSVTQAFHGNRVVRRRTRMEVFRNGDKLKIYALITASPFSFRGRSLALLVVEDIRELAELQRLIPICSVCRKVRDDKDAWMQVESYFKNSWDVDFSHGYCPECYAIEVAELKAHLEAEAAALAKAREPHR